MVAIGAGGVGLAREFGHAILVVELVEGEIEEGSELLIEVWFSEGAGGAFVASGFQKLGSCGECDGPDRFHEV